MASLTECANRYGTDKGTMHGYRHGYTLIYELLFAPYRNREINLLEIGLQAFPESEHRASRSGTDFPSVRMWHEYFPLAHIYGVDICDFSAFTTDWFTFFQVDCGRTEQLERVAQSGVTFDIIIDDASHASFHQQMTLCTLFKSLSNGGLYIIEDLHGHPSYERTLPRVPPTAEVLGGFLSRAQFRDTGAIPTSCWRPLEAEIGSIVFFGEDTLTDLRELFNARHGLGTLRGSTIGNRDYLRLFKDRVKQMMRAAAGKLQPPRMVSPKLVIIQKV